MRFSSAILTTAGLLASLPAAFAAITITSPSPTNFWVQFEQNIIAWQFTAGSPNPVDIVITNPNSTFLNGPYAIANGLDTSSGTFTVTNVTLNINPGYIVNFVNPQNASQIIAQSQPFDVKPLGTTPPNVTATIPNAASTSGAPGASGSAGSSTASSSAAASSSASAKNAAIRMSGGSLLPMFGMTVGMALFGVVVTL